MYFENIENPTNFSEMFCSLHIFFGRKIEMVLFDLYYFILLALRSFFLNQNKQDQKHLESVKITCL